MITLQNHQMIIRTFSDRKNLVTNELSNDALVVRHGYGDL